MRRMLLVVVPLAFAACTASGTPSGVSPSAGAGSPSGVSSASPVASVAVTSPAAASPSLTLATSFKSRVYGYTIGLASGWTVNAATLLADDPTSTDVTATDVVTVTGTDTTIENLAWDLGGQPFDAWLRDYRAAMSSGVPAGCDGGDPSKWPAVAVGDREGVWQQKCNAAVATVEYGGKAYQFAWENSTFADTRHLSESDFKTVLTTVTFPKPAASASPKP